MPVIIDGTLGVNAAAVTTTNWNPTNLSIPGNATIGDANSDTLTINGASVTFAGTATRIKADFSNDTVANQAFFQTTIANTSTQLRAIPNGSGTQSGLFLYGSSDIDNNSWGAIRTVAGTDVRIQSHTTGSGTLLPITFMTGTTERVRIGTDGKVGIGTAGAAATQLLTVKGRFNSDTNNNYYGAWGEGNTATGGYSFLAVGEWYSASAYFQKKEGQSFAHIYTQNSSHHLILQGGSGDNGETAASGRVGIGTKTPNTKLEIRDGAPTIRLQETTTGGDKRLEMGVTSGGVAWIGANQSAQDLAFQTVGVERMRIVNNGDIRIGDSLDGGNTLRYLDLYNTNTGANAGSIIRLVTSNSASSGTTTVDFVKYKNGLFVINNNDTSGVMAFNNAGAERLRISSNGNVGIGIASPSAKLHVLGRGDGGSAPSTPEIRIEHQDFNAVGTSGSNGGVLSFYNMQANNTGWPADRIWGMIDFNPSQPTSGQAQLGARILSASDGVIGGTSTASYLSFHTYTYGSGVTEKMRITSSGAIMTPQQPGFFAYGTQPGNTVLNGGSFLPCYGVHYNVGSGYNTGNAIFTAPVTGYYLVWVNIFLNQTSGGGTARFYIGLNSDAAPTGDSIIASSGPYIACFAAGALDSVMASGTQIVKLGAGDSIRIYNQYDNVAVYMAHSGWGARLVG